MAKLFIVLFLLLLSACTHLKKKDGPPHYYVDETKIANAVPKAEPLSKYGNMSSYRVFGKRYYTLRSSRDYNQVGVASWYGTQFHQHCTSSGERYDMLAMTAAHKTLPLPTYVEVTNLKNDRKIIVKVNDRGPFESNRIIDLSYVAAKKLGMLGHGTAQVRVKAINPYLYGKRFEVVKKEQSHSSPHCIYLQVGAFRNKLNALKFKQRLAGLVNTPVQVSAPSFGNRLYRVQIGPIKDIVTADKITVHLRDLGIKSNKAYGV